MASLQKNFIYSSILTCANYIFPLITFPYVSRVLGVDNFGICSWVDSIINYFILFSTLGISVLGIREIARAKSDRESLNETFSSLIILNLITTVIASAVLLISIFVVPQFYEVKTLLLIGSVKLLFNFMQMEWLFKGLEDFKYITQRSIFVRSLYVVSVFVFVRSTNDFTSFYILGTGMIVVTAILNCRYASKFVSITLKKLEFSNILRPYFVLGIYALLTSMYTSFNTAFLGFATSETEVGYYAVASRIYGVFMALFTAFTGVMLPRMSSLLSEGNLDKFKSLLNQSLDILFAFTLPVIVLVSYCAPEIIEIISGAGYQGAIAPMRIMMPLMVVIGYEQIIIIQALMPLGKDNAILTNSIIGSLFGVLLNFLLVPSLGAIGSALVWFSCEVVVLISAQVFITKYLNLSFPFIRLFKNIVAYLPLIFLLVIITPFIKAYYPILNVIFSGIIVLAYFLLINYYVLKNNEVEIVGGKLFSSVLRYCHKKSK